MKLVYDVGMHEGEDTEFYVKRGFKVVGIEANPFLAEKLQNKFAPEISSGQVRIVNKAIAAAAGTARMAVSATQTVFSTLLDDYAQRSATSYHVDSSYVDVECITFDEVLREYGMPYFLKIDIEGSDMLCLEALQKFDTKPPYVSVESRAIAPACGMRDVLAELRLLRNLGYSRFKYVNQAAIPGTTRHLDSEGPPMTYTFPTHSSGAFGAESTGAWHSAPCAAVIGMALRIYEDTTGSGGRLYNAKGMWRVRQLRQRLTKHADYWFDLHAAQ